MLISILQPLHSQYFVINALHTILSHFNIKTILDIRFNFSEFISFVEVTKWVKFPSPGYTYFCVGIIFIRHFNC